MIKVTPEISTKIRIPAAQKVQYTYNKVNEIVKKNQVQADFHADRIDITSPTTKQTDSILGKLHEFGINFVKQSKHE